MKLIKWLGLVLASFALLSCNKTEPEIQKEGNGIQEETWMSKNQIKEEAAVLQYEFTSEGEWTASSSVSWCKLITESGVAGKSLLRISVKSNTNTKSRQATISIKVKGFASEASFKIYQNGGVNEQGDGKYREVNKWVFDQMKASYLWNEPVENLMLDFSIDYQSFFTSVLDGIAALDNLNRDDGVWVGAKRESYYSMIQSNAPTKAVGSDYNDSGFLKLQPTTVGSGENPPIGAAVMVVTPGTPAANVGIVRGDFITEVNGVAMNNNNYKELVNALYKGGVTARVNSVRWNGPVAEVVYKKTVEIGTASYTDPAIYKHTVIDGANGKKIGYLLYMGFSTAYDQELINVFKEFKAAGVKDLIVDLRHNPGGEILSSTVMNTLIAGPAHKGKISTKLVYNKTRTQAGESGEYRIGTAKNVEYPETGYALLEEALTHSLELKEVYVIVSPETISASEIVINGLRGLDIKVNLIGKKTGGKNVGMEGFTTKKYGYSFFLYPVSCYVDNAKGSHDYANGFDPDLMFDDKNMFPGDFGTKADALCYGAIKWIETGVKPDMNKRSVSVRAMQMSGDVKMASRRGGAIIHPVER